MRSSTAERPQLGTTACRHRFGCAVGVMASAEPVRTRAVAVLPAAITVALVMALTACTTGTSQSEGSRGASPASSPSRAATPASPSSTTGPSEQPRSVLPTDLGTIATAPAGAAPDEDIDPGSGPLPTWDAASRAAVVQAATATMTAFAQPHADHERWWAGLREHVTPESAPDLVLIDPANIPASRVTGEERISADTSAAVASVLVPTDSGDWTLTMVRASGADPWLADRITPPAGQH